MKLSAILVSVNIVATLPVAAQAADGAVSDKAQWLKQNLSRVDKSPPPGERKIALSGVSDAGLGRQPRLRPFMPNRKLPSKRDLELALVAQQGQLDEGRLSSQAVSGQGALCGQVSTFAVQQETSAYSKIPASLSSAYDKVSRFGRRPAPRVTPGQSPSLPGQVASAPGPRSAIPRIPEPSELNNNVWPVLPQPPGEHLVRQSGALLMQAPVLTPDEKQMYDELVELNRSGRLQKQLSAGFNAQSQPSEQPVAAAPSDPGPPPFPLNMLPSGALKGLLGRSRPNIEAPRAYFGSWHKSASLSQLPETGFHSNITHKFTGRYLSHYAPAQTKTRKVEYYSVSQTASAATYRQPTIAMYPPYGQ